MYYYITTLTLSQPLDGERPKLEAGSLNGRMDECSMFNVQCSMDNAWGQVLGARF
jgi:hypothetical protein